MADRAGARRVGGAEQQVVERRRAAQACQSGIAAQRKEMRRIALLQHALAVEGRQSQRPDRAIGHLDVDIRIDAKRIVMGREGAGQRLQGASNSTVPLRQNTTKSQSAASPDRNASAAAGSKRVTPRPGSDTAVQPA